MISNGLNWTEIHTRCSHIFVLNISETPSTYSSPENSSGGSEVERTSSGVGVHPLLDELSILNLVSRHCKRNTHNELSDKPANQATLRQFGLTRAGNKKSLSADNNDLLAEEKLLGNNGSESAQKVALAVNNDSIRHDQSTNDLAILSIDQSGLWSTPRELLSLYMYT